MKRFFKSTKGLVVIGLVIALAAAVGAFAYFTAGGAGTGTAKVTGAPANLIIKQIGAGYDSLVPTNTYHQDQTYAGAGITQFGNNITLANPGAQQLVSAVVAFRNWGPAITNLPITLSIDNGVSGPVSDTETVSFPAAITVNTHPSTTNVTFDFSAQGAFVQQQFIYKVSFNPADAGSLNVALSSSANNLVVGTDTVPGTVYLNTTDSGLGNDFPTCTTTPPVATGVFESVVTNCGPSNGNNTGAYGNNVGPASSDADIPAVQFNVVGGVITGLAPGVSQPVDFAITNPGSSSTFVTAVTTSVSSVTNSGPCDPTWFSITGTNPKPIGGQVAPGTTVYTGTGTRIFMSNPNVNQNACENQTVNLGFISS